jgi:hypothetical protein
LIVSRGIYDYFGIVRKTKETIYVKFLVDFRFVNIVYFMLNLLDLFTLFVTVSLCADHDLRKGRNKVHLNKLLNLNTSILWIRIQVIVRHFVGVELILLDPIGF